MLLNQFEDVVIRVYSKKGGDYKLFDNVHELFKMWCEVKGLQRPLHGMNQ